MARLAALLVLTALTASVAAAPAVAQDQPEKAKQEKKPKRNPDVITMDEIDDVRNQVSNGMEIITAPSAHVPPDPRRHHHDERLIGQCDPTAAGRARWKSARRCRDAPPDQRHFDHGDSLPERHQRQYEVWNRLRRRGNPRYDAPLTSC